MNIPRSLVLLSIIALGIMPADSRARKQQTSPYPDVDQRSFSFELLGTEGASINAEQVTIDMTIIDEMNILQHPKVTATFEYDQIVMGSGETTRKPRLITACQLPMFKMSVKNESDQALKLRSAASGGPEVLVALDDGEDVLYAERRDSLFQGREIDYRTWATDDRAANPDSYVAEMARQQQMLAQGMQFLTDDTTVLPGRSSSFYVCFKYAPWGSGRDGTVRWMQPREELVLGLYDVPVLRDEAGDVLKKSTFEYPIKVSEWNLHWTYQLQGERWVPVGPKKTKVR